MSDNVSLRCPDYVSGACLKPGCKGFLARPKWEGTDEDGESLYSGSCPIGSDFFPKVRAFRLPNPMPSEQASTASEKGQDIVLGARCKDFVKECDRQSGLIRIEGYDCPKSGRKKNLTFWISPGSTKAWEVILQLVKSNDDFVDLGGSKWQGFFRSSDKDGNTRGLSATEFLRYIHPAKRKNNRGRFQLHNRPKQKQGYEH